MMTKTTGKFEDSVTSDLSWREFLRHAAVILGSAGLEDPLQEARYLSCMIMNMSPAQLLTRSDQKMTQLQCETLTTAISRRAAREPAAYIIGRHGFYGRDFVVGQGVLIPRPDTETLIEQVLKRSADLPEKLRILDTFTGSGCIGITLALELTRAGHQVELDLADISVEALAYAKSNINAHSLNESTRIHQTNVWPDMPSKWDLITANPPYINRDTIDDLQPEVSVKEPLLALDGGADGLDFYRVIYRQAADKLSPRGIIACEHGFDQAEAIKQIANEYGWHSIYQYNDFGGNPRVTICDKI